MKEKSEELKEKEEAVQEQENELTNIDLMMVEKLDFQLLEKFK
jgi:hypothetical protein